MRAVSQLVDAGVCWAESHYSIVMTICQANSALCLHVGAADLKKKKKTLHSQHSQQHGHNVQLANRGNNRFKMLYHRLLSSQSLSETGMGLIIES